MQEKYIIFHLANYLHPETKSVIKSSIVKTNIIALFNGI